MFIFINVYFVLQNSYPVWEDFNIKAGRLHTALRLVKVTYQLFALNVNKPFMHLIY